MKVKICGITRAQDALLACSLGASYIGFIFAPKSPRAISPEDAASIIHRLPEGVGKVGVFVNENPSVINEYIVTCGLTHIQLHGDEDADFCAQFAVPVIKAIKVKSQDDIRSIEDFKDQYAVLLDTKVEGMDGGTGKIFDWNIAKEAKKKHSKLFLAGGLTHENILSAIETVNPYAVDISSGVEDAPGIKNGRALSQLFEKVNAG